jgi:polyhydroxyalkanoate synthesis regulator phasin
MQELSVPTLEDVERLKKRVQHLEEEVAKLKMKMSGKKWL